MDFTIKGTVAEISLSPMERVWACHPGRTIEVPLATIQAISTERPENNWRELRAPGTYVPGLIKAGTYYADRQRAFWYVTRGQDLLHLELKEGHYRRVVLGAPQSGQWRSQLQAALSR